MKAFKLLFAGMLYTVVITACAQQHSNQISRELSFADASAQNLLYLANINGNVSVEGYSGNKVVLEAKRTVKGRKAEWVEQGKQEIDLEVLEAEDSIVVYIKHPCNAFPGKGRWNEKRWTGYQWNKDCDFDYDFNFDFTIKVPYQTNLFISTINDGDVNIKEVKGEVEAKNINGGIFISGISGRTDVHTINGDVVLDYARNPTDDSKFYTLNGDIKANFRQGLSANMSFKSFNGEFYTNIQQLEYLPTKVEKYEGDKGKGVKYKIGDKSRVKVRNGGTRLDFETFNGDVYVKEVSN
ncbi:MAG: hypothetical protein AAFX87_21955 [Bacteroidota bacterium]